MPRSVSDADDFFVLHLVRAVTATSMPWNDLYKNHRRLQKRTSGFVLEIDSLTSGKINREERSGVKYFSSGFISIFLLGLTLARRGWFRKSAVIIHVHNMSLIPIGLFFKVFKTRTVLNVHNSLENFNSLQTLFFKFGVGFFDKVICVSESVSTEVCQFKKSLAPKVSYIRNGIDAEQLRNISDLKKMPDKEIDVVIVARMVEQKNVERVLGILGRIKSLRKVVWFGDGIKRPIIENLISKEGLSGIVDLMGVRPREEVLQAVSRSTLYLSLARWEGIGVANIEALGLPTGVLLSDIPPHREIVLDDESSLVALDLEDDCIASEISGRILEFDVSQDKILRRAGEIRTVFDLKVLVGRYLTEYASMVN